MVEVARSNIEAILRGICLCLALCTLGPAIVVHDNCHSRLRTTRKTMLFAIYGALVVIWLHLTPARRVKHHRTHGLISLVPLLGRYTICNHVILARIAHHNVDIAQPPLKVRR